MGEKNNNEYEFVTETIKKKPVNKKRLFTKVLFSIALGVLAGIVACLIFAMFAPAIYERMNPEEPELVTIPADEQEYTETENNTGFESQDTDESTELYIEKETDTDTENGTDLSVEKEVTDKEDEMLPDDKKEDDSSAENTVDQKADAGIEEKNDDQDKSNVPSDVKTFVIEKEELSLDDYKKFYSDLNTVANNARRSLTKVTGVTNSTDWFNNSYELGNVSSGLIVADNGKELLIITNSSKLENAKEIEVTFCDERTYKGTVKKADHQTGLVVVAVVLEDIDDVTKNSYTTAQLGNSTVPTLVGTPVIALGSPLGIEDSMAIGLVTSNTRDISHTDTNIRYITTDIYGSTEGSGILIDLDGKVIGILFQGGTSSDTKNLIHAYSISDIKSKIEKLSNGQDTAYLGIIGTDVTKSAMEELNVPEGAYVKQVVVDSPAMKGGIQNGDVIVKLGTTGIKSFKDYKVAISKCQPGDTAMVTVKRLGKDGYVEFSYEIKLEALE